VSIHFAAEHALEFEPADVGLERPGIALDVTRSGIIILALGQLEEFGGIADGGFGAIELIEFGGEARTFASQLLGALGGAPDRGVLQLATYFLETFLLAIVLKETPSRRRHVPRDL
jgi:hypothetical protein